MYFYVPRDVSAYMGLGLLLLPNPNADEDDLDGPGVAYLAVGGTVAVISKEVEVAAGADCSDVVSEGLASLRKEENKGNNKKYTIYLKSLRTAGRFFVICSITPLKTSLPTVTAGKEVLDGPGAGGAASVRLIA